ncbi:ABC transporter substrate-binding protein [Aquabacterium sp. A7-Y]|uniref:ABC transporter substrate-binding protein n=1 Tax=Aquabacterium sp. A7-Y TaxID=1349605 RepID=UPI00223E88F0|nr:ABC transporter substrate-binding protein [Aquabacterium sp. A7-Y]MCW7540053.1 ABC transporter substrate-binding protein [Aquabacterium sp. A7-Y]
MKLGHTVLTALLAAALSAGAAAQAGKTSAVLAITLEPPGLDPTTGAGATIGEIVHYNVLEGLTKIHSDGRVTPLLAESWSLEPDGRSYTFKLRRGVPFHDGESFDASDVKFSFERAKAEGSTNKAKKAVFDNIARIDTPDPHTVILTLNQPDSTFLFRLGENTAVILDPKSAAGTATRPIGTGPYKFDGWAKGSAVTLSAWSGFRAPQSVKIKKVTFRFINHAAAQVAALLAGDVDAIPRFQASQSVGQFRSDPRFSVTAGGSNGKTIVSINHRRKPFDDVRVRRALSYAVDRKAIIDGAMDGFGTPIGSHMVPGDAGYVDLTGVYPHNPEKARALLKEAGVATPLKVTLTLPPPVYARRSGEVVAAQLAKVGIHAKIENVEWAQWLSGAFKGNFDLTIISHVEPLDLMIYANPQYYFGYDSAAFRALMERYNASINPQERLKLIGDAQRMLANDAANVFLFQLPQIVVSNKRLKGLWSTSPIFVNDMSAVSWQ